jgi:anti-anti-sigma factor
MNQPIITLTNYPDINDMQEQEKYFTYRIVDNTIIVVIESDRMDMYNAPAFLTMYEHSFTHLTFTHAAVDVRKLEHVDGTAIGVLMVAIGRMKNRSDRGQIVLISGNETHRRMLDLVRSKVKVFGEIDEALQYLATQKDPS